MNCDFYMPYDNSKPLPAMDFRSLFPW